MLFLYSLLGSAFAAADVSGFNKISTQGANFYDGAAAVDQKTCRVATKQIFLGIAKPRARQPHNLSMPSCVVGDWLPLLNIL